MSVATTRPLRLFVIATIAMSAIATSAAAQSRVARPPRGQVEIDGVFLAGADTLIDTASPRINAESAQVSATYDVPSTFGFSGSVGYRVWRSLAVGVAVSRYSESVDASVTGAIPHPFSFNQSRQIQGTAPGLTRQELSIALQARGIIALTRQFTLTMFAGPVHSSLQQESLTSINYSDSYPYDTATFASPVSASGKKSIWGIGAGADLSRYFSRRVGAGVSLKFNGGKVRVPSLYGGTLESKVGGFQIAAGGRFKF